ncbi:MAG: hypothetical protein M3N50_07770 [Pseudomonadota bacterium]|nr:hypothetical protein [Pseudomonadota bacterium]
MLVTQQRLIMVIGAMLALAIRMPFADFESQDYVIYVAKWYDFIQAHGVFHAFRHDFYDYAPLYLHLLSIATLIPIAKLYAIKTISVAFDFVGAYFAFRIIDRTHPQSLLPAIGFVSVLLVPTAVLNGSAWGQCDMIYCSMVLAAICYSIEKRFHFAFIFFGVALSLKLQACFVLPLFFLFWIRKECRTGYFLYLPLVYLMTIIPALLAGRHLKSLLSIYLRLAVDVPEIAINVSNVFSWIPSAQQHYAFWSHFGLALALAVIGTAFLVTYIHNRNHDLGDEMLVKLALFSTLAAPFFLPHMHDRYFFVADIISVIYVFFSFKRLLIPLIVVANSLVAYLRYLFDVQDIDYRYTSIAVFLVLTFIFADIVGPGPREMRRSAVVADTPLA